MKRFVSFLLSIVLIISLLPVNVAFASSNKTIAGGEVTADVSEGAKTVYLPFSITGNTGFGGMKLKFDIPEGWSISRFLAARGGSYSIFYEDVEGMMYPLLTPTTNVANGEFAASYQTDIVGDGVICWVGYTVPAGIINGDYEIGVTIEKINTAADTATNIGDQFEAISGKITVDGGIDPATLTPAFTTQPADAAYSYGDTAAALSVSASVAAGNLSYQWYSNTTDSNQGGTKINGATSASYTPELTTYGDAYYYCVVTNTYNERAFSAASEAVKITYQKAVVSEVQLSSLGIADPVKNAVPQTEINTAQYTGTITWNGNPAKFLGGTAYTASVTLNLKDTTNCEFASNVTVSGATNVQLNGQTLTFDVVYDATAAKELAFIAITKNPTKINYIDGETFAADGMEVTATYDDGTTEVVTGYTYPDAALVTGQTVVTVTYGEKTADVTVTVEANTLESIAVSGDFKKDYTVGDAADWTGMVVTATYKRGNTETVTGTVSGFDTSKYAESQTITVSYTEDGVTKTDTFTISVDRITNADDNFTVNIPQGAVYNGEPHAVTVTPKAGVTAGAITVYYDGSATAPTDVGTYAVTYSVAVSDTHTALDNVPAGNLVIAPKSVDVSVNDISAQTYDGSAKEPAVTLTVTGLVGEDQLVKDTDYTVSYSSNTNAGTATVSVTAKAGSNYTFTAATQNFVIEKQGVDIPTANTGLVYNDSEQIGVTLPDGAKYTLIGNTGTNAGSYTATATLTDSANYKWNGVSEDVSAPQNIAWTIGRKVVDRDPSAVTGLVYTGSEQTGVAGIEGQYTVTGGKETNAGNYEATAVLNSNYKWTDDTTADKTVEWSIAQAEVTVPNTNVTFTYDGSEKTAVAAGDHYTISGDNAKTDVGSYTVTLALESANYKWATEFSGSFTWTITASDVFDDATNTNQHVVVGVGTFSEPKFTGWNGEAVTGDTTYTYNSETKSYDEIVAILKDLEKDATTSISYTFNASGNYTGTKSGTINVTMVDILFKAGDEIASSANAITVKKADPTYGDSWNDVLQLKAMKASLDGEEIPGTFTIQNGDAIPNADVQTYTVIFSAADTSVYQNVQVFTGTVTFAKKSVEAVWTDTALTYNGGEQKPAAAVTSGLVGDDQLAVSVSGAKTDAGTYTAEASITDTNYTLTNATASYTIAPKSVAVAWSNTALTYNGSQQAPTATVNTGIAGVTVEPTVAGGQTAAGSYTATASTENGNFALDNTSVVYQINPKSVAVTIGAIENKIYSGTEIEPDPVLTVTGLVGEDQLVKEADYTVSYSNNTNAGTATVTVTAKADSNYTFTAATQNFVIEKQGVDIPTANTGLVYSGSEQTGVTLPDGAKYTLSGNTGTNAGSYTAIATLTDSANYKWNGVSENESAPQNIAWAIGRKVVDRDPSAVTGLVYTGSEQTGVAGIEGQYTVTNGAKIDAGNYEATAALTSNYKWSDDTTADKTVEWSIAQAEVTVPNTNVTFTYDGSEKTAVAAGDHYTISGDNAKTDVGSYTVTLALESANYKWATEFSGSFTWTITKAAARTDLTGTASVRYDNDEPQVVDKNTFLADAKDIVITDVSESSDLLAASADSDGNLTFTLDDSVVKANAGQTAEITVTFNSRNYADGSKIVITVTITDKINIGVGADENKISFTGNSTLTYNGTAQTPVFALADGFTAGTNGSWTYEYKLGGDTVTEMKNAGTYTVTASYEDDTYFGKSEPVTITVNPAALTIVANSAVVTAKDYDGTTSATITAVTFDGLLGSDALTLGTDYTVAGVFADKNAGQNKTVTVTVALSDTAAAKNYTVSDTGVATGTINPKNVTVSVNDIADQTFDGSAKKPAVTLTVTGLVGGDQLVEGPDYTVSYSDNTNAGIATVTVTAEADSNYTFIETGKNFTINKASAPTLSVDGTVDFKYTVTGDKTVTIQGVPANAGTADWSVGGVTDADGVLNGTPAVADGVVSFVLNGLQAYSEGITATITVTVAMDNYADAAINAVLSIKDRDVPEVSVENLTVAYTGVELTDAAIEGTASVDGSWVWVTKPAGTAASETPYDAQVKFVPTDLVNYTEVTRNITVTINKADPAGTPAYTAINTSGKTLADAELAVGTLTPADGTLVWLDQEGTPVADPTAVKVEANKEYTWQYTPADTDNYNVVTGKITPYVYIYNPPAGGGGGGASTKPSTSTEVTKNEDGSTTTTVTDNKTGTVTETTTKTETTKTEDGSTITTDTKVETVTNKDGAVTTTTTTKTETADKTETVEVKEETVVKEDGTTETKTTSTTTAELADGTTATSTTDETGKTEAQVTVSEKAAASEEPVVLPIPAVTVTTDSAKAATVTVTIDSTEETTVEIPVADVTPGAVIVIVNEDGTEEVVKKTGLTENGLAVELEGSATVKIVENSKTFVDVDPDVWYADGVDFASSRELYNGVGNDRFDPNGDMTRGMLVTVLHRMEDEMEHAYEGSYHDVVEGHWATDAIHWASDHGIVDGYGNGCYGTNDSITREQMITMVYRYLNWMGVDTSARGDLTAFNDHGEISSWAQEAVQWGVGIGIINGVGNDMLDPGSCATRAQVAVFMQRVTNLMF